MIGSQSNDRLPIFCLCQRKLGTLNNFPLRLLIIC